MTLILVGYDTHAGILTSAVYSFAMTLIILVPLHMLLKATTGTGVRVSEEARSSLLLFIIYFQRNNWHRRARL